MTKKTRYLLILTGFVCFLIFAPFIVLYVRGVSFDLKGRAFVKTGILAIKTEPKSTQIFLDGKLKSDDGGDIKFLVPKEYEIKISKPGFFDWVKRLPINSGEVTWVTPLNDKLFLLKNEPESTKLASGVLDFYAGRNRLFYLNENGLTVASLESVSGRKNYPLPNPVNDIKSISVDERFFLLATSSLEKSNILMVFDAQNEKFWDISTLPESSTAFKFGPDGQLLSLEKAGLYQTDFTANSKNLILKGVKAFSFQDGNFYYIAGDETGDELFVSNAPGALATTLLKNLPSFSSAEIFVNFKKQILLLLDDKLYKVAGELQPISEQLSHWNYEAQESALIFFHSGQLDYYSPESGNAEFVTRSSEALTNLVLKPSLHYAFTKKDSKISALELDTRDRQNEYILYQSKTLKKFSLDSEAKHIFLLDNGELKSLTIR